MQRQFQYPKPFPLETADPLQGLELAYTAHGAINKDHNNVIWICHALTANSDPMQWWPDLVGNGKLFDPGEHFIICVNILGSCYGSTGPLSVNQITGHPYYHTFPFITVR